MPTRRMMGEATTVMRTSRVFFWILLVTSVAGSLLLAAMVVAQLAPIPGGRSWITEGGVVLTLAAYALFGYAIARVREMGHLPRLLLAALIATALGAPATAAWIWMDRFAPHGNEVILNALVVVAAPAAALCGFGALTGLLIAVRLPASSGWLRWARRITIGIAAWLAVQLGLSLALMPWIPAHPSHGARTLVELNFRIAAILGVLIGCGVIALVAAVYRLRLKGEDVPLVEPYDITVTCPRCQLRQPIRTEGARCAACKLNIRVSLS